MHHIRDETPDEGSAHVLDVLPDDEHQDAARSSIELEAILRAMVDGQTSWKRSLNKRTRRVGQWKRKLDHVGEKSSRRRPNDVTSPCSPTPALAENSLLLHLVAWAVRSR